jgi:hypothetical protein
MVCRDDRSPSYWGAAARALTLVIAVTTARALQAA